MYQNYLKLALRNLSKNRLYTLLNVLGLGVGITLMIWGYQTYRFCFSMDDFHADKEHLFRVVVNRDGNDELKGVCPLPVAKMAQRDFASITESVRWDSRGCDIKGDHSEPFSEEVHFTDPSFFTMFNFPLVSGAYDLTDKNTVLMTEKMVEKYFGKTNPLGKTLLLYTGEKLSIPLQVSGVLKDVPTNSSFRFNFITNFENLKTSDSTFLQPDDWKWFADAVILKIPNAEDAIHLASDFNQYLPQQNAARKDWLVTKFQLLPLSTINDQAEYISSNGLVGRPNDGATYGGLMMACLIFLSACLNFANTTVSRSNRRLREMGVRKVMGGTRSQLMRQMLLECGAVVAMAIVVSVVMTSWWVPTANSMFDGLESHADFLNDRILQIYLLGLFVFTTLVAGSYPAFYISSFNPSRIFRGAIKFGGNNLFSRVLLGLQVVVSLITVVAGVSFARNATFQKNFDYGYNRSDLIGVSVPDQDTYNALRNAVQQLPGVESVAGTRHHIGFGNRSITVEVGDKKREVNYFEVGDNYTEVMNLHALSGRLLETQRESDYNNAVLISQKMATEFGWTNATAVGQQIRIDTATYAVVGAINDIQLHVFEPLAPAIMRLVKPERYTNLIIKARPGDLISVHDRVKAQWAQLYPLKPFRGFYQDEIAVDAMKVTQSISTIFTWLSVVAMLLTATGLFALVSLTILKKMKEIALRKVVGAKPSQILLLVSRGYAWIFGIAIVIGCWAGLGMTKFLMDTIFKINVGVEPLTMVWAVLVLLLIAMGTVGFKVRQALQANPADVLRAD
jgi:putative ABC transport system permease protein